MTMHIRVILPAAISNLRWTHASLCNGANAGVAKAIVRFHRNDSDSAFERFRSRTPKNDVNTVHALKKHLVAFLGLKELARKFGLGGFDIKILQMAPKAGRWEKRQLRCHHRWPVEAGTTKLAGWHRK